MEPPQNCSVCGQPLRPIRHAAAHGGEFSWQARAMVCPHVLLSEHRYDDPRHDEWHLCNETWVRREP
ncbi:MAG TPA: hypothetical protein VFA78_02955 [Chloroflexota bacterium]|nr:hypothetical protein [Chloroflexota bacterium]